MSHSVSPMLINILKAELTGPFLKLRSTSFDLHHREDGSLLRYKQNRFHDYQLVCDGVHGRQMVLKVKGAGDCNAIGIIT